MDDRLRAVCDLMVPAVRGSAGLREYDGVVPDLSPDAVAAALDRLGGPPREDPHDEAHLAAFEEALRVRYGALALHRRSPQPLLAALDVSGYDRDGAPVEQRQAARRRHLARWPDAIAAGLSALEEVPAPLARALLGTARGLAVRLDESDPVEAAALRAHGRLVARLEDDALHGPPSAALGSSALARLLGVPEAMEVDLGRLEERADAERRRLRGMLAEGCAALRPGAAPAAVVADLVADHPDAAGVLERARALTREALAFTAEAGLLDELGGECRVAPSPPSRRWATAMLAWPGPHEPDGVSWFFVTPPEPSWPPSRQADWLSAFSDTTLPATTVHEVAPGHFAHGRMLRRVRGDVRRTLFSPAFVEGWAHYAEELCVEEGLRRDDPRFLVGVTLKALLRVTRLAVSLGVHTGTMDTGEPVARFHEDAFVRGPVAEAEAARAAFDPTYGRYTWGKLTIMALRDEARRRWGAGFGLRRFHQALLALGSPPLGLLGTAIERG